ncbi:MAG: hypothetical protein AB7O69_03195 [Burkholderiales bacterium]
MFLPLLVGLIVFAIIAHFLFKSGNYKYRRTVAAAAAFSAAIITTSIMVVVLPLYHQHQIVFNTEALAAFLIIAVFHVIVFVIADFLLHQSIIQGHSLRRIIVKAFCIGIVGMFFGPWMMFVLALPACMLGLLDGCL